MSKKILSVMLALVMVLSVFSIVSFAAVNVYYETYDEEAGETEIAYTQKWSLKTENVADANGKYTVDVVLETNYGVGPISFAIVAEGATLESAVEGAALIAADGFNADVRLNKTNNIVYIIPEPASEGSEAPVLAADSVIATLTFALTADTATVAIMNDAKLADNAGNLIAARPDDGTLACNTIAYGQRVIDAAGNDIALGDEIASVELGKAAAEPADLVLTETGSTNGVIIDTNKTFGDAYAGVVYGVSATTFKTKANITNNVTASNGGSIVVTSSTGQTTASGNFGTGSTIEVLNADDTSTGKIYVFVVFGDVDGNGLINAADGQAVSSIILNSSLAPNNSVKRMAANCQLVNNATMMHTVNANDRQAIMKHLTGTKINQATYAAKQNSYNNFYQ